ncbi:MAG: hypothetical protein HZC22_14970 [Rhodocyclales bacterium]|nr:hypothetical protein [Rhodocyclales bacterium]
MESTVNNVICSNSRCLREDQEGPMIVRRRVWMYRLAGQLFAQSVSFARPVTAAMARSILRRTVGQPLELWGRAIGDLATGPA